MINIKSTMLRIKERSLFIFLLCISCTVVATVLTGVTKISNVVDIIDGNNKYSVYTVQTNLEDILKQENIILREDDKCSFSGFENDRATLTIYRAFEVPIAVDATEKNVTVSKSTVKEALEKAGVTVSENDRVTPSLDTILKVGDKITVNRVTFEEYQETQEIPYGTVGIDRELSAGEKKVVVTPGVKGQKTTTYRKIFLDGIYAETIVVADKVITMPVNEVLKIEKVASNTPQQTTTGNNDYNVPSDGGSLDDVELLARLVNREIGGGSSIHKQMVAEVIMNRVRSPLFPNTVVGVITQSGQFDDVENYWTQRKPDQSVYDAVRKAMAGSNVAKGALYFYAPAWTSSANAEWFETKLTFITEIEGHRFFK